MRPLIKALMLSTRPQGAVDEAKIPCRIRSRANAPFQTDDYHQTSMLAINYQDQLPAGIFAHTLQPLIDSKPELAVFVFNQKIHAVAGQRTTLPYH
jgi:hypothetical protein